MNVGLWGWDGTIFRRVLVDAAGHLQVDVLTAPAITGHCYGWTGAAWTPLLVESLANANLRTSLYHGVNQILSVATAADIADANRGLLTQAGVRGWDGTFWKSVNVEDGAGDGVANARASLDVFSRLYGYNGTTWDRLRVESAAAFNLRVKLYDGANGISSQLLNVSLTAADRGLVTSSYMSCYDMQAAAPRFLISRLPADASPFSRSLQVLPFNMVYNGATWDMLRSWGVGVQKVGRAEIDSTTVRKVAVGQVIAGAHNLYWVACNPAAGNSLWELTDAIAGGGAVVYDHFDTTRDSHHLDFDPPMKFATGIYLETFTNMTSLIFCYV